MSQICLRKFPNISSYLYVVMPLITLMAMGGKKGKMRRKFLSRVTHRQGFI